MKYKSRWNGYEGYKRMVEHVKSCDKKSAYSCKTCSSISVTLAKGIQKDLNINTFVILKKKVEGLLLQKHIHRVGRG